MIDGAALVKDLLSDSWTKANTNSREPTIKEWYEYEKEIGVEDTDRVLVYDRASDETITRLGNSPREVVYRVSVDLRTDYSKNQGYLMLKEIKRILRNNISYIIGASESFGDSGENVYIKIGQDIPFSNNRDSETSKIHKNFRHILDVELLCYAEALN